MKKKILVTGANGLLGQKIVYSLKDRNDVDLIASGTGGNRLVNTDNYRYLEMDITNPTQVSEVIVKEEPKAVINCAAMTNVDACEIDQENVG